jgi:pilus assembly protein TadC
VTAVVVLATIAVVMLCGRGRAAHRSVATSSRPGAQVVPASSSPRSPLRIAVAAVALLAGTAVIGGVAGIIVGVVLAVAVAVVPARGRPRVVPPDDVAIVIDLVAGCLDAGATLPDALDAAGLTSDGLLRHRCVTMALALRRGATGAEAWQSWLDDPSLAGFARTAARTSHTGAAAAADFRRTAARLRAQRRARAQQRVRQASVWLVVPLGLCFLPAFVLVAVVPIVVGLFPTLQL